MDAHEVEVFVFVDGGSVRSGIREEALGPLRCGGRVTLGDRRHGGVAWLGVVRALQAARHDEVHAPLSGAVSLILESVQIGIDGRFHVTAGPDHQHAWLRARLLPRGLVCRPRKGGSAATGVGGVVGQDETSLSVGA